MHLLYLIHRKNFRGIGRVREKTHSPCSYISQMELTLAIDYIKRRQNIILEIQLLFYLQLPPFDFYIALSPFPQEMNTSKEQRLGYNWRQLNNIQDASMWSCVCALISSPQKIGVSDLLKAWNSKELPGELLFHHVKWTSFICSPCHLLESKSKQKRTIWLESCNQLQYEIDSS